MARCDCCDKREKEEFQPLPASILEVEDYIAASPELHDQELPIPDEDDRCVRLNFFFIFKSADGKHFSVSHNLFTPQNTTTTCSFCIRIEDAPFELFVPID